MGVHVGDFALHQFKFADGLAELFALADVGDHHIHGGLHDAQRAAGQDEPFVVQAAHQDAGATAHFAQNVFLGYRAVLEYQLTGVGATHAQFVQFLVAAEAGEVALDDEGGDAPGSALGIGLGVDDVDVGIRAVGDPHLVAVEDVVVAGVTGGEFHGDDVGTGIRLGHGQGADVFAADQFGQVFAFLFFGAVAVNLVHAQVGVGAVRKANGGGGPADFFHGDDVGQVAHVGTAVLLLHGNTQQAHVAELTPEIHGELVVPVDVGGPGRDFCGGEAVDLLAEHVEGFTKAEIEL